MPTRVRAPTHVLTGDPVAVAAVVMVGGLQVFKHGKRGCFRYGSWDEVRSESRWFVASPGAAACIPGSMEAARHHDVPMVVTRVTTALNHIPSSRTTFRIDCEPRLFWTRKLAAA